jgi:hypothetical protein
MRFGGPSQRRRVLDRAEHATLPSAFIGIAGEIFVRHKLSDVDVVGRRRPQGENARRSQSDSTNEKRIGVCRAKERPQLPHNEPAGIRVTALKRQQTAQKAARFKAGTEWVESGLVFTSRIGTALDDSNVRKAFAIILDAGRRDVSDASWGQKWGQNRLKLTHSILRLAVFPRKNW